MVVINDGKWRRVKGENEGEVEVRLCELGKMYKMIGGVVSVVKGACSRCQGII